MTPLPIVLDTDPGVDDALAMMLALSSPELDVVGVCTVNGNVPLDVGTKNALKILGLLNRTDVPVYRGAACPLMRSPVYATEIHGIEGMGAAQLPLPNVAAQDDAVGFLVRILTQRPDEVTVVAVGPLTNLALAEQKTPGVLQKARQVIVMGGAIVAPGNASPGAEFNFFADPHAARIVVQSGAKLTLVPLDATHQVGLTAPVIDQKICPLGTPRAQFVVDAVKNVLAYGETLGRDPVVYLHDPLAVGLAMTSAWFERLCFSVDIETSGELTMGQVVTDRRQAPAKGRLGHSVMCVMGVDAHRFLSMFLSRTLGIEDL